MGASLDAAVSGVFGRAEAAITFDDIAARYMEAAKAWKRPSTLREDKNRLLDGVRLEIVAASNAVALAQKAIAVSADGLAAAEESYRVRKELLAAERATAVEIVDAETQLTQARFAAINARIDLRVALSQLRHATGQDVK